MAAGALLLAAGPALAADEKAASFQAVLDCRKLTDDVQRLACFDKAAASLETAEKAGDVVVVSREQARATRRQAFGFTLPSLDIFNRGEKEEALDRLEAKVVSASQDGNGKWHIEIEGGAWWVQTDNQPLSRRPKEGSRAAVRKAAMGSYFMNLDGQTAIRVRRER
jgi:hypothetical protein